MSLNLALDVNASDWDSGLEEQPASTGGLVLRLMTELQEAEARDILAARQAMNGAPLASVGEAARRARVGQRALAALAGADAFASTGASRRQAAWDARGVVNGPQTLLLFAAATAAALVAPAPLMLEPAAALPPQTEGETVIEDYCATGLSLGRHPLALLRPALDSLGLGDTRPPAGASSSAPCPVSSTATGRAEATGPAESQERGSDRRLGRIPPVAAAAMPVGDRREPAAQAARTVPSGQVPDDGIRGAGSAGCPAAVHQPEKACQSVA